VTLFHNFSVSELQKSKAPIAEVPLQINIGPKVRGWPHFFTEGAKRKVVSRIYPIGKEIRNISGSELNAIQIGVQSVAGEKIGVFAMASPIPVIPLPQQSASKP